MPYRSVRIVIGEETETVWSRVSDEATKAWLPERAYLRSKGYPDRPPDVDTPTLRLWLARPSEEALPYFRRQAEEAALRGSFPVYTVSWHAPNVSGAKVIVTGLTDGSLLSRVVFETSPAIGPSIKRTSTRRRTTPNDVWDAVTRIVGFVNEAARWEGEPLVTDYGDHLALEAEVEAAKTDARAAGFLVRHELDA